MAKGTRVKNSVVTENIQKTIVQKKGPVKFDIELNNEQKEAKALIIDNKITVLTGPAGTGKAQPLSSKILTPDGWTTMGELKINDEIITQSGKTTKINGIFPQGEKEIFMVSFSDNSSTMCCKEHLWNVKDYHLRNKRKGSRNRKKIETEYKTIELSEIIGNLIYSGRLNYSIPIVEPIKFKKNKLPLDPYFLGLLLGDGGTTHSVSWSSEENELIEFVNNYVKTLDCNLKLKKDHGKFKEFRISSYNCQKNKILDILREIDCFGYKSENKFIPDLYKYSNVEDRIALLQGLMDTDGSTNGISTTFHTSSQKLRDDVIEIIRSLGGTATYSCKIPKYKYLGKILEGKEHYNISIKLKEGINPFKLQRKANKYIPKSKYIPVRYITNIKSIGNMLAQCISVEDESHLYITDDYIVTHNTLSAIITAMDLLFKKEIKKIYITRPLVTREQIGFLPGDIASKLDPFLIPIFDNLNRCYNDHLHIQKLIETKVIDIAPIAYMRGRTIEDGILIIDEAQNMNDEDLKMCLTRIGKEGKIVVCGDAGQIDLKDKSLSGIDFISLIAQRNKYMAYKELKSNHRHEVVELILKEYEKRELENKENKK